MGFPRTSRRLALDCFLMMIPELARISVLTFRQISDFQRTRMRVREVVPWLIFIDEQLPRARPPWHEASDQAAKRRHKLRCSTAYEYCHVFGTVPAWYRGTWGTWVDLGGQRDLGGPGQYEYSYLDRTPSPLTHRCSDGLFLRRARIIASTRRESAP